MPWNRQSPKKVEVTKRSRVIPYAIAAICVCISCAALWMLSADKTDTDAIPAKKEVSKKKAERLVQNIKKRQVKKNIIAKKQDDVAPKKEIWMGREIVSTKIVTNGIDLIITRIDKEGKKHKEYTSTQKRLFKNPVDVVLAILLTTPEGAMTPPLPSLGPRSDELFAKALKTPIEILDTDTEEEKNIKQLVIAAREQMLDELDSGRSVNDVIEDHCTFADQNNRFRAEAMVQYKELIATGNKELAEEFRVKANELISSKGGIPFRSLDEIRSSRKSKYRK